MNPKKFQFNIIDKLTISLDISISGLINAISKILHGSKNTKDIHSLRALEAKLLREGDFEAAQKVRELIQDIKIYSVKVSEPKNVLISSGIGLDSKRQAYIKAGAGVYSGMTGELLFVVNNHLKFPFDRKVLERSITNIKCKFQNNTLFEDDGVFFQNQTIEFAPLMTL